MIELDKELFRKKNPFAIFRGCFAYFSFPTEVIYFLYHLTCTFEVLIIYT